MAQPRSRVEVPADSRDIAGDFAHRHLVEVRLSDTDAMGHVNNARYLTTSRSPASPTTSRSPATRSRSARTAPRRA